MRRISKYTFLAVLLGQLLHPLGAQENRNWSAGTAYTIPQGRWETGLFQPVHYASSSSREWIVHPFLFPIIPNLIIKQQWQQWRGGQLAFRLGFQYPTPLLRLLRRSGTGGVLAPDPTIPKMPHMFRLRLEAFYSRPHFSDAILMTYKAGIAQAFNGKGADIRSTIDLPVIYPRMAVYYNGFQFNGGVDALIQLAPKLTVLLDGDLFWTPGWEYPLALENKLLLAWHKTKSFTLQVGLKYSLLEYPPGKEQHLIPLFDIMWSKKPGN